MKPVIIFRHAANEGPGEIASYLQSKAIPYRVVKVDSGETCPLNADKYSGLVFMGGPMSVNDKLSWIPASLELIEDALARDKPVLGICLGAQLIARAAGARIYQNKLPEFGWFPVSRVEQTGDHPLLAGVPRSFEVFHWHGETFDLPPDSVHLLQSEACLHQAFALGNALGIQCHPEINEALVRDWAENNTDLPAPGVAVQSREAMLHNLESRLASLQPVFFNIMTSWAAQMQTTAKEQ